MQTSYFGNRAMWEDPRAVSIARYPPRRWKGRRCYELAPPGRLIKLAGDEALYREEYYRYVLNKLDARAVYDSQGEDAILICYEKPGDFCHRRLVAEWLERELGVFVEEV